MKKHEIEEAVKAILDKEDSPLATAFTVEVANYEHALAEMKLLHRDNLRQLLYAFTKRGITNNDTKRDIEARLKEL